MPTHSRQELNGSDAHIEFRRIAGELREAWKRPEATIFLALDQAEKLIAPNSLNSGSNFLNMLRDALLLCDQDIVAAATLRSDQLEAWQTHPSIMKASDREALVYELFPLDPFPMDSISEVVRGPAELISLKIDDDLVDAVRADTKSDDALPLLAYALREMYEKFGENGRLTKDNYETLGRLDGVVQNRADTAVDVASLSREAREALQAAFVPALVRATGDGRLFLDQAKLDTIDDRARPVVDRLINARLLTTDLDRHGDQIVEIAHKSLLRVWPLLAGWLAEDEEKLANLAVLQRAAETWERSQRSFDYLDHRDQRLTEINRTRGGRSF